MYYLSCSMKLQVNFRPDCQQIDNAGTTPTILGDRQPEIQNDLHDNPTPLLPKPFHTRSNGKKPCIARLQAKETEAEVSDKVSQND